MSKSVKIKPIEGVKVFNPATKLHIDSEGAEVILSTYWRRIIKSGDVEVIQEKTKEKVSKPKKTKNNIEKSEE